MSLLQSPDRLLVPLLLLPEIFPEHENMRTAEVALEGHFVATGDELGRIRLALVPQGVRLGGPDIRLGQPAPVPGLEQRVGPPVRDEGEPVLQLVGREAVVAEILDRRPWQDGRAEELVEGRVRRVSVVPIEQSLGSPWHRG